MIVDASDLVLGRMATNIAKAALLGEDVSVVNCEKCLVKNGDNVYKKYVKLAFDVGQPQQGPFIQKRPDLFVKRVIRGMLPYKNERGATALKRVKCYIGVPEEIKGEFTPIEDAKTEVSPKYLTIGKLCRSIGGKI